MLRKLLIALVVLGLVIAGLQIFGGRDFGQVTTAFDKLSNNGSAGEFLSDLSTIFKGGKVKESVFPDSRYEKMVMYRWVDEKGEVHVSERKPNVAEFEEIRLGDMQFQIQEGMSDEEIEKVLKKGDN